MSRVVPAGRIRFPASASADVVNYRMYYRQVGTPDPGNPAAIPPIPPGDEDDGNLSYNDLFIANLLANEGEVVVELGALQLSGVDGSLRVGLSAIDDVGNESDIGQTTEVPFDQDAPEAPGAGVYES